MSNKIDISTIENSYIQVVWEDDPSNFTQERIKRVRAYFEKKYHSKNVNVITKVRATEDDIQSVDISMDILDKNFQKGLIKKFLDSNGYEDDLDAILEIDSVVEDKIAAEKADITPFKKWYIKNIEFSNFLSYDDNQKIDFDQINGIGVIESNPPNYGGKTVLAVDFERSTSSITATSRADFMRLMYRRSEGVIPARLSSAKSSIAR